ncbi:hypothetical protein [Maribacter flavus]|uniref:Uncharacterized protein n=1 Tax=Maribacter flavus TaxID=1658664 RepID=A0A5B2TMQ7_9FLAO|nr:hypothetical protein [Maribacter flavus]KAA2215782.1 hypothetical protein F0361_16435 [Maribacter flavus]
MAGLYAVPPVGLPKKGDRVLQWYRLETGRPAYQGDIATIPNARPYGAFFCGKGKKDGGGV